MRSGEEMAPTETGYKDGEENSPHSSAVKNLSLRGGGECRPLSPVSSSAPDWDSVVCTLSLDDPTWVEFPASHPQAISPCLVAVYTKRERGESSSP